MVSFIVRYFDNVSNAQCYQIQNDVYGNFNDDTSQNWSIMFRNKQECQKFATNVALAKALTEEGRTLVKLDFKVGQGGKVIFINHLRYFF